MLIGLLLRQQWSGPPRPEALMGGIVRLHEKIRADVPPAYDIRGVA